MNQIEFNGLACACRLTGNRPPLVLDHADVGSNAQWTGVDCDRFAHDFIALAKAGMHEQAWQHFFDGRGMPGRWAAMSEKSKTRFRTLTSETVAGFLANFNTRTTLAECAAIRVPTTVVVGSTTAPWDIRVADLLGKTIATAEVVTIEGANHMSPLSHSEAIASVIEDHLARP